jgi:hypothetical protein
MRQEKSDPSKISSPYSLDVSGLHLQILPRRWLKHFAGETYLAKLLVYMNKGEI